MNYNNELDRWHMRNDNAPAFAKPEKPMFSLAGVRKSAGGEGSSHFNSGSIT